MVKLVKIVPSHLADKKYDAHFLQENGRTKVVPFGARGMDDFTKTKDVEQQRRYIERHSRGGENWSSPMTAGALSRYVLWSAPTLRGGIANFKKRFSL